jgi:hypothetical protein
MSMTELLISEITLMREGFCVIGVKKEIEGFRSVRPVPPRTIKWPQFPYNRGDRVEFNLNRIPSMRPHLEDSSVSSHRKLGTVTESGLVESLKQAEVASSLEDLFGCCLHPSLSGGDSVFARPDEANRSVCGCEISSIQLNFRYFPESIRASITLPSGEILPSLPVVDRDWRAFIDSLATQKANRKHLRRRLDTFFGSFVEQKILLSPIRFARIGLTRPMHEKFCWLMLDSLFPLPQPEWRDAFR